MNRNFKIFFFLLTLLSIGTVAKCTSSVSAPYSNRLINRPHVSHACNISGMNNNKPDKNQVLILFRNGIDEKGFLFSHTISYHSNLCLTSITDDSLLNSGRIKHVLSFADLLALPPEFLSSSSFRSPPILV